MITKWHKFRAFLVLSMLTAGLIYLIQQLHQIQLVEGGTFREKAARQHRISFGLSPRRGTIYDRRRKRLAVNVPVDSIYAHPSQVESVEEAARKLSPILKISPAILQERLERRRPFVWLAKRQERGRGAKVEQLGLSGINYVEEVKRYYPKGKLAAHLLGFVGLDGKGLEGLEFYYERYLRGTPGRVHSERDAWGREILPFRSKYHSPLPGLHLVLTIDAVIQSIVERELERVFQESQAQGATIVIMEPETGAILAMANRPTHDPNSFPDYLPAWRRNRAITDAFEPGSTFKVITAAAALEEGLFQLEDKIYGERGSFRLNGRLIRDVSSHGWLTFKEVMGVSSNIGFAKIGEALGEDKLYYYISSFGFGARTDIDFPGEREGLVRSPRSWSSFSLVSLSFGQELMVTALQLVSAISAIANGGVLMQPRIVDSLINEEGGVERRFAPRSLRRVISADTAEKLTEILVGTVEEGTGGAARVPGYRVAGKTGTAQKAGVGGFIPGKYLASFVGYLPADAPQLVILVVIDEPQGVYFGGKVAAPVFSRVAEQVMAYLKMTDRS